MNTNWGRPSPLDELRNQSNYFPDMSRSDDGESVNSSNEYTRNQPYMGSNRSMMSFETIQTNERLLDKLELDAEDEALLQQVLKEEEERRKKLEIKQHNGPVICMPASQFPSLRIKGLSASRDLDSKVKGLSLQSLNLKGNLSSSAVEQHYATKSRYSYLAEEDTESELNLDYESSHKALNIYGTRGLQNQTPVKTVNFENNQNHSNKVTDHYQYSIQQNKKQPRENEVQVLFTSKEPNELMGDKTPQKNAKLYHSGSGNSTKTSFTEQGQLSKPKTQSSAESDCSPHLSLKGTGSQEIYTSSPSPVLDDSFLIDISKQPVPAYKAHRKRSTFSLKNLFKSPKSTKSKSSLESRNSLEKSASVQSSVESSPKKRPQNLRKFIFPANPVLHFDPATPRKTPQSVPRKLHHYRSLSDFHKTTSPPVDETLTDKLHDSNAFKPMNKPRRKLSLDSRRPAIPVSSFQTPPHSRNHSGNNLQFSNGRDAGYVLNFAPAGTTTASNPSKQIDLAIQMRNCGKLEESARRLHNACLSNDPTAYLLYGLALRHGYGVPKDYAESFRYIKLATGIKSEEDEVFNVTINPFEIERTNDLPNSVPEPKAPALYECGMAYLKGYGFEDADEQKGLKYLEKAASLGHIDSMCLSATIWSKKTASRRKDVSRAAVWFRLAEKKGAKLVGSDWIHIHK